MNRNTYVVVGPLRVDDLCAVHPDIIQGYPSATSVAGIGYKMVLDLGKNLDVEGLIHEGTAVIVHDHSFLGGHPKNPVSGTDATKGAPIIDEFRARAELSFVISIGNLEVHDEAVANAIFKTLPGLFFGGGKVFPKYFDVKKQVVISSASALRETLKKHKSGSILFDRHDLLEYELASQEGKIDALDALLNCIEFRKSSDQDTQGNEAAGSDVNVENKPSGKLAADKYDYARKYPGWLVPLLVGFQGIEQRQKRAHTRTPDGVNDHVFAESLYSLGEYKSLASILASEEDTFLEGSFWKHCQNKASETFYVTANS